MPPTVLSQLHLSQISDRLERLRQSLPVRPPPNGWLNTIRRALGMRTSQLAALLDISQPAVVRAEEREVSGAISLETLRRMAGQLDCDLVYYLVPRAPLLQAVEGRAELLAHFEASQAAQSVGLEWQLPPPPVPAENLRRRRDSLVSRRPAQLWASVPDVPHAPDVPHMATDPTVLGAGVPGDIPPQRPPRAPRESAGDPARFLGGRAKDLAATHIQTLDDLLVWEQSQLIEARNRALSRSRAELLSVGSLIDLHGWIFGGIWRWAGQLRRSEHAEGARWPTIGIELNDLVGEVRFWRERKLYSPDDLALRFHHRLLRIRAWEGGNGVHARLAADLLAVSLGRPSFDWGGQFPSLVAAAQQYDFALREADAGLIQPLVRFARAG